MDFVLTHWRLGNLRIPQGVLGYLSKEDWGDTPVFECGVPKVMRKGTFFVNTVSSFSDEKWDRILEAGNGYWLDSQSRGEPDSTFAQWDGDDHEDDDFVLESG